VGNCAGKRPLGRLRGGGVIITWVLMKCDKKM
jgi:hypothetical protein